MIKKILLSVGVFLLCVSVALPMIVTLAFLPSQYSRTFFGELDEKYERLRDVDGPRLVIVGGSSVAFGYDSALLEELLGMPVVNFGLYADLGTKIMLDLSARQLRRGDVVLLAPELDAQTLSLFFNGASALKALDDRPSMLFSIDGGDFESVWGGVWQHTADKWKYLKEGAPDPAGIYNSASFNDYGDIKAGLRPENTMTGGYDSQKTVDLSPSIYSEDFVAYLNDYIKAARKKGADVYYTFCPVNAPSLDLSSVPQGEADPLAWLSARLLAFLDERLDCPVVGSPADFVMREALFYDSNFHLNDTGVPLHTAHVAAALRVARGDRSEEALAALDASLAAIRASERPGAWRADGYRFALAEDGVSCIFAGVDSAYRSLNPIEIPAASDGCPVVGITADALSDCHDYDMIIFAPGGASVAVADGAFDGAPSLSMICLFGDVPSAFPDRDDYLYFVASDKLEAYAASPVFAAAWEQGRVLDAESELGSYEDVHELYLEAFEAINPIRETSDRFFVYTSSDDATWTVTALTEEGKAEPWLVIPHTAGETGQPVAGIDAFAFRGSSAEGVVVPADTHLRVIANSAFAESGVGGLYLYVDPTVFDAVYHSMVDGAPDGFAIWVYGADRLAEYQNNYYWSVFSTPTENYYRQLTQTQEELTGH